MTRWQQFYLEDQRISLARPSICARHAADDFRSHNKCKVLDLGCGTGRDTAILISSGLGVVGVDAAWSGLSLAQRQATSCVFNLAEVDARCLPFGDASFEGVYCFGLLHEFVGETADGDVSKIMSEIERVLQPAGRLVLAVLAGEPTKGLPHVRLFTEQMFDDVTHRFQCVEKQVYNDIGCTGRSDYRIWRGTYIKS